MSVSAGLLLFPTLPAFPSPQDDPPAPAAHQPAVPGVVIDASPDPEKVYVGSPSIAVLPSGEYVASHDWFGPGTTQSLTCIFRSADRGLTWEKACDLEGQWWSSLFLHEGALYIMGTTTRYGLVVIRRSADGGLTWTTPADSTSGLLLEDGRYHTAPVPVMVHAGRIWRSMEDAMAPGGWPAHFRAFVLSIPAGADLLDAAAWTASNRLGFEPTWLEAKSPGWLEGNLVSAPDGSLVNILRVNDDRGDRAALTRVSADGQTLSFDPAQGFIDFPGGRAKFTIRFDETSGRYWSLANKQRDPAAYRNILVLTSSADLREWRVESIVLQHGDDKNHAFQYIDWLIDGADIIAVSRTAWDGAHRAHDANFFTFHRIEGFRGLRPGEPPATDGPKNGPKNWPKNGPEDG